MCKSKIETRFEYKRYKNQPERTTLIYKGKGYTAELTLVELNSTQVNLRTFIIREDDEDRFRTNSWKRRILVLMARTLVGLYLFDNKSTSWYYQSPRPKFEIIGPHLPYVQNLYAYLHAKRLYIFVYAPGVYQTEFSSSIVVNSDWRIMSEGAKTLRDIDRKRVNV